MSDTIKDAIHNLTRFIIFHEMEEVKKDQPEAIEQLSLLTDRIADLERQLAERRWIPVTERLPGLDDGAVSIAFLEPFFGTYKTEIGVGYYDHPDHYEDPKDGTGWRFWIPDQVVKGGGVTHWMPLPERPKEGEG